MKKIRYVFLVLFLVLFLSSCVNTNKKSSSESNSESTIGSKLSELNPADLIYENGTLKVTGINENADLIKLYYYDELIVKIQYSHSVNNTVVSFRYTVSNQSVIDNTLIFKAVVTDKNNNYGEITRTVQFLGSINAKSIEAGEHYLKFDKLDNVSKYKIQIGDEEEKIYDTNEIEFEENLNDKIKLGENYVNISITPISDSPYYSYTAVYKFERIRSVSEIKFTDNKITFTSPTYDGKWKIVIDEAGEIVEDIITTKSYNYTPKGHNFTITINGYLNNRPTGEASQEVKAINNIDSLSFDDKYIIINDSSETNNRSYNYQMKVKDEVISSGSAGTSGINFDRNYYRYYGSDVVLTIRKSVTYNEYLIGETVFNLKSVKELYVSSNITASNIVNNELSYKIQSDFPSSKVRAYLYDSNNELVDSAEFLFKNSTPSVVTFKYDNVEKYKVVIERELPEEDGYYYMNLARIHAKYEFIYDIPEYIDVASVENYNNNSVIITADDLKDMEVTLYKGTISQGVRTGSNNTYTILESEFSQAMDYNMYLVSKKYTKSEPVLCTNYTTYGGSSLYISENYPADAYKVDLYNENNVFLMSKLTSDPNSHSFNLSGKSYKSVYMVFTKENTYSKEFTITKLATPTLSIDENTLKFSGGENYCLMDGDNTIYTKTELDEYLINYDNLNHSFKLKAIADNSKFEINSSFTTKMDIKFIDNPVIEVYDQTLYWENLKDKGYSFDVYLNNDLETITDAEIDISSYIDTNNQVSFRVIAKSDSKYILSSQEISYTVNKKLASNVISNVGISNSDKAIKFSSSQNEAYSYHIYDNSDSSLIIRNITNTTNIPVELEPGEYRIDLSVASKIDDTNHIIEMTSTEKVGLVFVQDGVKSLGRSTGSKYSIQRVTDDLTNVLFKLYVGEVLNTTTTSNEFVVDLSSQEVGAVNVLIKDESTNSLADSEKRFKFADYEFEQTIVKAPKLTLTRSTTYPTYTLFYNTEINNPLTYPTMISTSGNTSTFTTIEYVRYYNNYYLIPIAIKNGLTATLEDTHTAQSTTYNYDANDGCYRVLAKVVANDFRRGSSEYTLSSDQNFLDYVIIQPISRINIGIRNGSGQNNNGLLYMNLYQQSIYPYGQTSNGFYYKIEVSGAGTYNRSFKRTSSGWYVVTAGTETISPGINIGKTLEDGDIVNIRIYTYNDYGESARLEFNNLAVSYTIKNYGYSN